MDGEVNMLTKLKLAENLNTSPETLVLLAKDEDGVVRCEVAQNPNTSPETLVLLAKDKDWMVREYTATNSNTILNCLIELIKDKDSRVSTTAFNNPKMPHEHKMLYLMEK